jgi:hypothetical protein
MNIKNTKPTADQITEIQKFYDENDVPLSEVGKKFGWNRHTLAKYLTVKNRKMEDGGRAARKVKAVTEWRRRTKQKLIEHMGGKCVCCGYDKCARALQFHHLDPSKKDFQISGMSISLDRLKEETKKCILVCSNCHAEIHDGIIVP